MSNNINKNDFVREILASNERHPLPEDQTNYFWGGGEAKNDGRGAEPSSLSQVTTLFCYFSFTYVTPKTDWKRLHSDTTRWIFILLY